MWRIVIALFLIAHGLVHAGVWATPRGAGMPFDPGHSWFLDGFGLQDSVTRPISIALALVALIGFVGAGLGLFAGQEWWRALAVSAAAISLLLVGLYFHPWLSMAVALNAGIALALLAAHWPSPETVGA